LHWALFPTKTYNRTLFFGNILLKHGHHFDYWNQPLNRRMRFCYLDSHEAGLCCYLVIHIENLLLPLQLFHCHLWPIYWLSPVYTLWWTFRFGKSRRSLDQLSIREPFKANSAPWRRVFGNREDSEGVFCISTLLWGALFFTSIWLWRQYDSIHLQSCQSLFFVVKYKRPR
jgi:hypothetical protein